MYVTDEPSGLVNVQVHFLNNKLFICNEEDSEQLGFGIEYALFCKKIDNININPIKRDFESY